MIILQLMIFASALLVLAIRDSYFANPKSKSPTFEKQPLLFIGQ